MQFITLRFFDAKQYGREDILLGEVFKVYP